MLAQSKAEAVRRDMEDCWAIFTEQYRELEVGGTVAQNLLDSSNLIIFMQSEGLTGLYETMEMELCPILAGAMDCM